MEQNTNSASSLRLQPRKSNNIGNIVQEHIRYWRKFDDEKEAKQKIENARQAEFKRKIDSKSIELYQGLTPEENKGFLNSQIVDLYESKKDELLELSRRSANGDADAIMKYNNWKNTFSKLANVNKVYGEKGLKFAETEADYNPFLDKGIKDFRQAISKGMYKINSNGSIDIFKGKDEKPVTINASQLLDNEYLTSSYSGKPKFDIYGKQIATTLLDNIDGSKEIDPNSTRLKGIGQIKSILQKDNVEGRSGYASFMDDLKNKEPKDLSVVEKNMLKKQANFNELSSTELTLIADDYYTKNVADRIQQVVKDTALEDSIKNQSLTNAELLEQKRLLEIDKIKNPNKYKQNNQVEFKIQAITDDEERLAKSKGKESNDLIRFEGFKPFKVLESKKEGEDKREEPIIKSLKLDENDKVYYVTIDGVEDRRPFIIDQVVTQLKFKDKNELVKEMKANRDLKLKQRQSNNTLETFDPTKF